MADNKVDEQLKQISNLKHLNEELQKQLNDWATEKTRLSSVNVQNQANIDDLQAQINVFQKTKNCYEATISELRQLEENSTSMSSNLSSQLNKLKSSYETLQHNYDTEVADNSKLRNQITNLNTEITTLKHNHEKELSLRIEEFDTERQKLHVRIVELQDIADRETIRANGLEKLRNRLIIEIQELQIYIENNKDRQDNKLEREASLSPVSTSDLALRSITFNDELDRLRIENEKLAKAATKAEAKARDSEGKPTVYQGELDTVAAALADAKNKMKLLLAENARQKAENDQLQGDLINANNSLSKIETQLSQSEAALIGARSSNEGKIVEKDNEIKHLQHEYSRRMHELTIMIENADKKYTLELSNMRKKYEALIQDLHVEIEKLSQQNNVHSKEIKHLKALLKEVEADLQLEKQGHEYTKGNLKLTENKRDQLKSELDEVNLIYESAIRAKRTLESTVEDNSNSISELTVTISHLNNDKHTLEAQFASIMSNLDTSKLDNQELEEKLKRLQSEINRLTESTSIEVNKNVQLEVQKKRLENQIRELQSSVEEAEASIQRECKKLDNKYQNIVRDLESKLEIEGQRAKDAFNNSRKFERMYRDSILQKETDQKCIQDLQELLDKTTIQLKTYKRQLKDSEHESMINLNKFRVAQQTAMDAEQKVDLSNQTIVIKRRPTRFMRNHEPSLSREVFRAFNRATSVL